MHTIGIFFSSEAWHFENDRSSPSSRAWRLSCTTPVDCAMLALPVRRFSSGRRIPVIPTPSTLRSYIARRTMVSCAGPVFGTTLRRSTRRRTWSWSQLPTRRGSLKVSSSLWRWRNRSCAFGLPPLKKWSAPALTRSSRLRVTRTNCSTASWSSCKAPVVGLKSVGRRRKPPVHGLMRGNKPNVQWLGFTETCRVGHRDGALRQRVPLDHRIHRAQQCRKDNACCWRRQTPSGQRSPNHGSLIAQLVGFRHHRQRVSNAIDACSNPRRLAGGLAIPPARLARPAPRHGKHVLEGVALLRHRPTCR